MPNHRALNVTLPLVLAIFLLASCTEKRTVESYIPADAAMVLNLHTDRLLEQVFEDTTSERVFLGLLGMVPGQGSSRGGSLAARGWLPGLGVDPGLNISEDMFVYVSNAGEDNQFTGLFVRMNDADRFEKFLKRNNLGWALPEIFEKEKYKMAWFADKKVLAGWNEDILVLANVADRAMRAAAPGKIKDIFWLPEQLSILSEASYLPSVKREQKSDAELYINLKRFHLLSARPSDWLYNYPEEDEYVRARLNFGDQKLDIEVEHFVDEQGSNYYHQLFDEREFSQITHDFSEEELICFLNIRYSKDLVPRIAQARKLRMTLKAINLATGLSEAELYQLAQGDVFFACSEKITPVRQPEQAGVTDSSSLAFVAEMVTGPNMPGVLVKMTNNGLLMKPEKGVFALGELTGFDSYMLLKDEKLLITDDSLSLMQQQHSIAPDENSSPLQQLMFDYPLSGYISFEKLRGQAPEKGFVFLDRGELQHIFNLLDEARFYTRAPSNETIESSITISFNENQESSFLGTLRLLSVLNDKQLEAATAMNPCAAETANTLAISWKIFRHYFAHRYR